MNVSWKKIYLNYNSTLLFYLFISSPIAFHFVNQLLISNFIFITKFLFLTLALVKLFSLKIVGSKSNTPQLSYVEVKMHNSYV